MIYDLTEIEKLYWTKTQKPVFKTSMTELCCRLLEFLARATCHLKKHPVTKTLKDMFNQGGWDSLLSAIEDAKARVNEHSGVNGLMEIREIREAQKQINRHNRPRLSAKKPQSATRRSRHSSKIFMSVHGLAEIATNPAKTEYGLQSKVLANGLQAMTSSKHGSLEVVEIRGLLFSS